MLFDNRDLFEKWLVHSLESKIMSRNLLSVTIVLLIFTSCTANSVNFASGASNNLISVASLSVDGPYEIKSVLPPSAKAFSGATIYFPIDSESPVGGVAIAPGYTHRQRHIN